VEGDDLIGLYAFRFVDGLGVNPPEPKIVFGPDNEKGQGLMQMVEAGKVQITPVEKINGPRFDECCFSNYFVVNFLIKLSLADLWQIILMGKGRVPRPFRLSVCF